MSFVPWFERYDQLTLVEVSSYLADIHFKKLKDVRRIKTTIFFQRWNFFQIWKKVIKSNGESFNWKMYHISVNIRIHTYFVIQV